MMKKNPSHSKDKEKKKKDNEPHINRPLYAAARVEPTQLPEDGHTGLWYERFFNQYDANWRVKEGSKKEEMGKQNWIEQVAYRLKIDGDEESAVIFERQQTDKKPLLYVARLCGDSKLFEQYRKRMAALISKLEGDCEVYATDWHFVTGLGLSHPVENGFSWHPTLGVPYLPGSAVKGLLRAWVTQWTDLDIEAVWFGEQEGAGDLIFFDALPIKPVELTLDVMTPHMGKWYEEGGEISEQLEPDRVPADWHNPVPVPFLAVKKGSFIFALASRSRTVENVKKALAELDKALEVLGAGAKTAVGYGRFRVDEKERKRREEEKAQQEKMKQDEQRAIEEAKLSPEEKALRNLQQAFERAKKFSNEKPGGELSELLSNTMKQAESSGNWSARDKTTLADIAEAIYKLIGWGSGAKKQEKRDKISRLRG